MCGVGHILLTETRVTEVTFLVAIVKFCLELRHEA